ncbi:MAG: hypothetical protein KAS04_06110, partial [Candidatus Aenigmarchaeota archaeon]|nr:hypothetical protein [Candidatus Aenigmarchaeota archaeon]
DIIENHGIEGTPVQSDADQIISLCVDEGIEALHKVITDEKEAVDPEWPVSAARVESFEYGVNMSIQSIKKLKQ